MALRLSATRIETFLLCRLKYKYNYFSKTPTETPDHLKLGSAVHSTLEATNRFLLNGNTISPEFYKQAYKIFDKEAIKEGLSDRALFKSGKEMIMNWIDTYIPEKAMLIDGKLGLEYRFYLTLSNYVPITGAFDKIIDMGNDVVGVKDYKTSKIAMTFSEAVSDVQVGMYDAAARQLFPGKEIVLIWHYLRPGLRQVKITVDPSHREEFMDFLSNIYDAILNIKEEDLTPNINKYCSWCAYKDICPAYKDFIESANIPGVRGRNFNDPDDFVNEWIKVKILKKIVDNLDRDMKMAAHEWIRTQDSEIVGEAGTIYLTQSARMSYDPKTVFDIIPESELVNMVSVSKKAVDEYIEHHPELKSNLIDTATLSYDMPTYRLKSSKKEQEYGSEL